MSQIIQKINLEYPEDLIDALEVLTNTGCTHIHCEECGLYVETGTTTRCVKSLAHNALRQIEHSKCKH